jgi:c-di-GMP-binding flagellar brake protein YcgR
MWDGFDKRKFPRLKLNCQIEIQPQMKKAPLATLTENVGVGGVCVIQNLPLERFSLCRMRLELQPNLPVIECTGKVVWIIERREPIPTERRFDTGIEFVDISSADRERIRTFIQEQLALNPSQEA